MEVEVENLKIELVAVKAYTLSVNQLFEDRKEITDLEERALSGLKMSVTQCRKKHKGTKEAKERCKKR